MQVCKGISSHSGGHTLVDPQYSVVGVGLGPTSTTEKLNKEQKNLTGNFTTLCEKKFLCISFKKDVSLRERKLTHNVVSSNNCVVTTVERSWHWNVFNLDYY